MKYTKRDFSQVYWLDREIEKDRRLLTELWARSVNVSSALSHEPKAPKGRRPDRVSRYAAEIADLETVIEENIRRREAEKKRLIKSINSVEDSLMRLILSYRFVSKLSWRQVARAVGGGNTADGVRKAAERFFGENKI